MNFVETNLSQQTNTLAPLTGGLPCNAVIPANNRNITRIPLRLPSQVFPNLFLGSEENAASDGQLKLLNISHILNVTKECASYFEDNGEHYTYKRIAVIDNEEQNIMKHFEESNEFIHRAILQNRKVLVHCVAGKSRSATIVIAYVMKHANLHLAEAFPFVKSRRAIIFPNPSFYKQLMAYDEFLFGPSPEIQRQLCTDDVYKVASLRSLWMDHITMYNNNLDANETLDETIYRWKELHINNILALHVCLDMSLERCERDRKITLEMMSSLLRRSVVTSEEVVVAFNGVLETDMKDLRMDIPKIDSYVNKMVMHAQSLGLLKLDESMMQMYLPSVDSNL